MGINWSNVYRHKIVLGVWISGSFPLTFGRIFMHCYAFLTETDSFGGLNLKPPKFAHAWAIWVSNVTDYIIIISLVLFSFEDCSF